MQIEIEPILHRRAVDFGYQPAGARQSGAVDADTVAEQPQFIGRLAGMLAAAAADMDTELALKWAEAALQSADDAGRDAGRMPIHSHHGAERLKPEGVGQSLQEFVAPVGLHNGLCNDRAECGHARRQPGRDTPAMER